jgi:hypothetical protein
MNRLLRVGLLIVACVVGGAVPSEAAFAHLGSITCTGGNASSATVTDKDTSGANLIVAVAATYYGGSGWSFSDSLSNSWTQATSYNNGVEPRIDVWYSSPGSVGAGHDFTVSGTNVFASLCVLAFSGADATPFDQQSGTGSDVSQPGSLTPGGADYLFVAGIAIASAGTPFTLDSGFTYASLPLVGGVSEGIGAGYLIQSGGPTAVNPTWNVTGPNTMLTFQVGVGGAVATPTLTLLGAGS